MRIINHTTANYSLFELNIEPGENIFDDGLWLEHYEKLSDPLKKAWFGGKHPLLSIAGDGGEQLAIKLGNDADGEIMSAKEKIAQVMAATEPEHLEALAQGEDRKTVMAAIQKRAKQLAEAA
jgi:hypothetical protein